MNYILSLHAALNWVKGVYVHMINNEVIIMGRHTARLVVQRFYVFAAEMYVSIPLENILPLDQE